MTKEQSACAHTKSHRSFVRVDYMEDTGRFMASIKIRCEECGLGFQFLGLPLGLNIEGAAMRMDGEEAHIAIAPVGRVMRPLEGLSGFGVKPS